MLGLVGTTTLKIHHSQATASFKSQETRQNINVARVERNLMTEDLMMRSSTTTLKHYFVP